MGLGIGPDPQSPLFPVNIIILIIKNKNNYLSNIILFK
jgi:hypothetical protein